MRARARPPQGKTGAHPETLRAADRNPVHGPRVVLFDAKAFGMEDSQTIAGFRYAALDQLP